MTHYQPRRPGCAPPSEALANQVRELILEVGPRTAAARVGLSRETLLGIGCGTPVFSRSLEVAEKYFAEAAA